MPDRLKELQHQRALVQQQLDWLDREIIAVRVAAQGETPRPALTLRPPAPPVAEPREIVADDTAVKVAAEEIMAHYQQESQSLHGNIKRGCFIYFFAALALVALGVVVLYLLRTKN